ncbi:MAG TPA: tRNA pseudouridine(54/55) synthase Pus10 [Desulfurococcales archaeon]|nr:tRNA pseudouridine(54/55) synthase Pus10 [Desulfurococcales archaeon]
MKLDEGEVLGKILEVLKEYALCDRCLGRLYARKGMGLDNKLRGLALKTLLTMYIKDFIHKLGYNEILNITKNIMFNPFIETLISMGILSRDETIVNNLSKNTCYICGGDLDEILDYYFTKVSEILRNYEIRKFHVGVRIPIDMAKREEELIRKYKFEYAESIKNEIKREIGKRVVETFNLEVDFEEPHAVILIDLNKGVVDIEVKPLLIKGRYLKIGRGISQSKWITRLGKPRTDISIAGTLETLCNLVDATELKIHAAGREDIDARMLGTGRPLIIELKQARKRQIPLKYMEEYVNKQCEFVNVILESETSKKDVSKVKMEAKYQKKAYRALIVSQEPLSQRDIELLEEKLRNTRIKQRTPLRVLHRRKDIVRVKTVYVVKCKLIAKNVIESLIVCQGGLYVKELIEGDNGRTKPSFSDIIGKNLKCVELDVLAVY